MTSAGSSCTESLRGVLRGGMSGSRRLERQFHQPASARMRRTPVTVAGAGFPAANGAGVDAAHLSALGDREAQLPPGLLELLRGLNHFQYSSAKRRDECAASRYLFLVF